MPVAAANLILYCSASRPIDDVSVSGGAIEPKIRAVFTQLAVDSQVEAVSASAGDTSTCTIIGRDANGSLITEAKALTGVTPVVFTTAWDRVLSVTLSADAVGIVTIRRISGGTTLSTIPVGERGFAALFVGSGSEVASNVIRYEKVFWKNTHATDALTGATITLTVDPALRIRLGAAPSKGDSASVANRRTAPSSVTFFDDSVAIAVPTGMLSAGEAIGVWCEQNLSAGDTPRVSTFTSRLAGLTT